MIFVLHEVSLRQVSVRALPLSPVHVIPPMRGAFVHHNIALSRMTKWAKPGNLEIKYCCFESWEDWKEREVLPAVFDASNCLRNTFHCSKSFKAFACVPVSILWNFVMRSEGLFSAATVEALVAWNISQCAILSLCYSEYGGKAIFRMVDYGAKQLSYKPVYESSAPRLKAIFNFSPPRLRHRPRPPPATAVAWGTTNLVCIAQIVCDITTSSARQMHSAVSSKWNTYMHLNLICEDVEAYLQLSGIAL